MRIIKELIELAKLLLTTKPEDIDEVDLLAMRYFPVKRFSVMWCGKILYRCKNEGELISQIEASPYIIHYNAGYLHQAKEYKSWIRFYVKYLLSLI